MSFTYWNLLPSSVVKDLNTIIKNRDESRAEEAAALLAYLDTSFSYQDVGNYQAMGSAGGSLGALANFNLQHLCWYIMQVEQSPCYKHTLSPYKAVVVLRLLNSIIACNPDLQQNHTFEIKTLLVVVPGAFKINCNRQISEDYYITGKVERGMDCDHLKICGVVYYNGAQRFLIANWAEQAGLLIGERVERMEDSVKGLAQHPQEKLSLGTKGCYSADLDPLHQRVFACLIQLIQNPSVTSIRVPALWVFPLLPRIFMKDDNGVQCLSAAGMASFALQRGLGEEGEDSGNTAPLNIIIGDRDYIFDQNCVAEGVSMIPLAAALACKGELDAASQDAPASAAELDGSPDAPYETGGGVVTASAAGVCGLWHRDRRDSSEAGSCQEKGTELIVRPGT